MKTIAARVPVGEMLIDKYQGGVNQNIVDKIAAKWDDSAAGCVILNLRKNGEYAVLDGQHRVLAAQKIGVAELSALVFIDKTYEEEARLFVQLNTKHNVSTFDRFKANLIGGNTREKTISHTVKELGLLISHDNSHNPKAIRSVNSLYKLYDNFGLSHLKLVLGTLQAAFEGYDDNAAYSAEAIGGMSQFFHRYPEAVTKILIEKLKKYSPTTICGMSLQRRDRGQSSWVGWGRAITGIYNYGYATTSSKRLPMDRWDRVKYTPAGQKKSRLKSVERLSRR